MTGRFAASSPGDQTLRVRQSSVSGDVSGGPEKSASSGRVAGRSPCCGACPVYSSASRTPAQGAGLRGGMKRLAPDVGAP